MRCKDCVERLEEYYLEILEPKEISDIKRHLESCQKCRQKFSELQKLTWYLGQFKPREVIPDERKVIRTQSPLKVWLPLAVAASILFALIAYMLIPEKQDILLKGDAIIQRNGKRFRTTAGESILNAGDTVFSRGNIVLLLKGVHRIEAEWGSALKLASGNKIQVMDGLVYCDINQKYLKNGFSVETPLGVIDVTGTKFLVNVKKGGVTMKGLNVVFSGTVVACAVLTGVVLFRSLTGVEKSQRINKDEVVIARKDMEGIRTSLKELTILREYTQDLERKNEELRNISEQLRLENEKLQTDVKSLSAKISPKEEAPKPKPEVIDRRKEALKKIDWKKFAKVMILEYKDPEAFNEPSPELTSFFGELMKAIGELAKSYNVSIDDVMDLPEVAKEMSKAFYEEAGIKLDETQLKKFDEMFSKELDIKPEMTVLERRINTSNHYRELRAQLDALLRPEQKDLLEKETGTTGGSLRFSFGLKSYQGPPGKLVNDILNKWSKDLRLKDYEKDSIRPSAENYVREYKRLTDSLYQTYGSEIMDTYLRPPFLDSDKPESIKRRREIQRSSEYRKASEEIQLKYYELGLETESLLMKTLGEEKKEHFRKISPTSDLNLIFEDEKK
jgi:hypothetical protein